MARAVLAVVCLLAAATWAAADAAVGPVVPKEKTPLFNGKDLSGWKFVAADPKADAKTAWSVADGTVRCTGTPAGCIRTEQAYADYTLHLEWRWTQGAEGAAGVLIHAGAEGKVPPKSIECSIGADDAGDVYLLGGAGVNGQPTGQRTRVARRADSSEKPVGEWNACDIIARGNTVRIIINDVVQNELGGTTVTAGPIGLTVGGKAIEFRNVYVGPPEQAAAGVRIVVPQP
jgi:hypothetical protein